MSESFMSESIMSRRAAGILLSFLWIACGNGGAGSSGPEGDASESDTGDGPRATSTDAAAAEAAPARTCPAPGTLVTTYKIDEPFGVAHPDQILDFDLPDTLALPCPL